MFVETHAGLSPSCCNSPGKAGLGEYVALAGGDNIGADVLPGAAGQLSLEYVIQRNPSIYVATGGPHVAAAGGFVVGPGFTEAEARASLARMSQRQGLRLVDAVRAGRVYGLAHQLLNSPLDIVALELLATWMHPSLFEDVHPEETLAEINRRFLAVPIEGAHWVVFDDDRCFRRPRPSVSTAAGPRRAGAARRAEQRSDSDTSPSEVPCFRLESPETSVLAYGVAHRLVETIPDLPGPELLARMGPHGADVLVGALPFDPERGASLIRPRRWWRGREGPGTLEKGAPVVAPGSECTVRPVPTRDGYAEIVGQALEEIDAVSGGSAWLGKVVLARELHVEAEAPFAPEAILAALRDGRATTFLVDLPPSESGASRTLVGASPELLVHKRGTLVSSTPLAGSAPRHEDPEQDRLAAERLRASAKDLREHRVVVDHVRDTLEPYCRTLHVDETPRLTSTGAMWHLATHVRGTLRDPAICALELARALHPTPAVCGVPAIGSSRHPAPRTLRSRFLRRRRRLG